MKKIFLISLLLALFPLAAGGDTIFLKDGTKIITKKAWKENGLIKFYLIGYESIIITYSMEIVERIEEGEIKEKNQLSESTDPATPPTADAGRVKEEEVKENKHLDPATKKPGGPTLPLITLSPDNKKTDGPLFYNPRRKHKYWVSSTSWHNTLNGAIAALAEKYACTPDWVKAHMGNTNILYEIHRNLAKNKPGDKQPFDNSSIITENSDILFYNPRRTHKYWTGRTSKHDTLESAIAALARKYDRTPEWVKAHMGNTNNLYKIHKNLAMSKLNSPSN